MPKILDTPETVIEQKALVVNRKDITRYVVDIPLDGSPSVSVQYWARQMDAQTGNAIDGVIVEAPPLMGDAASSAMAVAGLKVIAAAMQLLPLTEEIKAAVNSVAAANVALAGAAYYQGTRDALYDSI